MTVAGGGMSKADVKRWLFDHATIPLSKFSKEGIERRFRRKQAGQFANAPLDTPVHMWAKPEDLISEAQFKTFKYRPEFPDRFGCSEDARAFCVGFFD